MHYIVHLSPHHPHCIEIDTLRHKCHLYSGTRVLSISNLLKQYYNVYDLHIEWNIGKHVVYSVLQALIN